MEQRRFQELSVMRHRKVHGFTLIELLVVMSIVALLVALLLPALSKARDLGLQVRCSNNLRQNAITLSIYANEANEWFPNSPNYVVPNVHSSPWIRPYFMGETFRETLKCPTLRPANASAFYQPVSINATIISTSYNFWVGVSTYPVQLSNEWFQWQGFAAGSTQANPNSPVPRLSHMGKQVTWQRPGSPHIISKWVALPSSQPMMLDINNPVTGVSGSTAIRYPNNHETGQNMVYVDGHGAWRNNSEITQRYRSIFY